jgi:hypothetical protein
MNPSNDSATKQPSRQFCCRARADRLRGTRESLVALPSQSAIQFKPNPAGHSGNCLLDIYWLTHPRQASQNSGTVHVFISFLLVFCEISASFYAFIKSPNHNYG